MVLNNRKALKLVVCMSLIVALVISTVCLTVGATYENTHANTGNGASDIVEIAKTQVGYSEGYDGYTKYGDWYGLPNSDWCAMFVSWCANQAGAGTDVFPSFALCSAGADWFLSQGRFHYSGSYTPQAGDLIFYASYGSIYHVGLVTGSDGCNVYSIEGNYNEMVSNVSYSLSYGDILGYATPAYSTSVYGNDGDDYSNDDSDADSDEDVIDNDTDTTSDSEDEPFELDTDSQLDSESDLEQSDADVDSDLEQSDADVDSDTDSEASDTDTALDSDSEADSEKDSDEPSDADTAQDSDEDTDEPQTVIYGDVNDDGEVNVIDSLMVQRYLVLESGQVSINLKAADVNGSGVVDIGDAFIILKRAVGLNA